MSKRYFFVFQEMASPQFVKSNIITICDLKQQVIQVMFRFYYYFDSIIILLSQSWFKSSLNVMIDTYPQTGPFR